MKKSKVATIFKVLGGAIVIAGVIAGTILVQKNQDIREKAAPATTLFIIPSSQDANPSQTNLGSIVVMDTSVNAVVGLDLEISYDPAIFEVTSISQGSGIVNFDSEVRNLVDNTNGKIEYSVFTIDKTKAVTGSDLEVLNISYGVKAGATVGTHTFSFTGNTAIAATNEGQNVLVGSNPSSVNVTKIGDVNGDGVVNIVDIGLIIDNYQMQPPNDARTDLSGDGKVNIVDIGIVVDHYEF